MLRDKGHEICFIKRVMGDKGEHYKLEKQAGAYSQNNTAIRTFAQSSQMKAHDFSGFGKVLLTGVSLTKINSCKVHMFLQISF